MNSLSSLIKQIKESFRELKSWLCNSGMFYPDDDHSGIVIDGKVYTVVYTLGGKKMYIDEDGNLRSIHELDANNIEWEWKNINERHLKSTEHCFRTPGGEVKIISWWSVTEDVPDALSEEHYVINSSDRDNPVGKKLLKIPENWTPMRCELPDMEERTVMYVLYCFATPGGKVEVEGFESRDPETTNRISAYTVIRSTDPDISPRERFDVIPTTWVRVTCDFPDMTQRLFQEINSCFETPGGKVRVEGIVSLDPELGAREEYYRIAESTDPAFHENMTFREMPEEWIPMVCDFPDRTQRDTEIVDHCYMYSKDGVVTKVKVRSYLTYDYKGDVIEQINIILRSTDKSLIGNIVPNIPESWNETECEFADLTQRFSQEINSCFRTPKGKVRIEGLLTLNPNLGIRREYYRIAESTDVDFAENKVIRSIPEDWIQMVCDFPDRTQRDIEIVDRCYKYISNGEEVIVKVKSYLTYDYKRDVIEQANVILRSTDKSLIGDIVRDIPESWEETECEFADLTQRFSQEINACFLTPDGKVRVEGLLTLNPKLGVRKEYYRVAESTDPAFRENTTMDKIPDNWSQMVCDFPDRTHRDIETIDRCYKYSVLDIDIKIKVRSYITYDYKGDIIKQRNIVLRSTDKLIIGNILPSIPESWVESECDFVDLTQRYIMEVDDCYDTTNGEVRVKGHEFWNEELGNTKSHYVVTYSEDEDTKRGTILTAIPYYWTKRPCQRFLENVHECYASGSGKKFYVEGYRMVDGGINEKSAKLTVIEVSEGNTDVYVGDVITSIPSGYGRVSCNCNCGGVS